MSAHSGEGDMDSDAWRPFEPVDVKRQVGPGPSSVEDGVDDVGETTIPTAISLPATAITPG